MSAQNDFDRSDVSLEEERAAFEKVFKDHREHAAAFASQHMAQRLEDLKYGLDEEKDDAA